MKRDPVCGMQVDPNKAAAKMDDQGRTDYFCSADCQHPQQYAQQQSRA